MEKYFEKALSAIYKEDLSNFSHHIKNMENYDFLDKNKRSLIFYAIIQGNNDICKILLQKGAKINIVDNQGWTPLHYAVSEYHVDICKMLISEGAYINAKDSYGNTIIWRAVFTSIGRGEIIKILLKNGADPSIENISGVNATKLADTIANYDVKQFLKN